MGSRPGSSIGAFLMSLPVSAMLLMAVFGVPRFAPGTSGESNWQNAKQFFTSLTESGGQTTARDPFGNPTGPGGDSAAPFAAAEAPHWGGANDAVADNNERAPLPRRFGNGSGDRDHATRSEDSHPLVRPAGSRSQAASGPATITWKEARRKLADLGVSQFHLEPGLSGDEFLFVCLLTPGGDTSVTQRFEAEAADPLVAVEQVLTQIDQWLSQQYARESQALSFPQSGQF